MVGPRNPASVISERRGEIYHLLIKGESAQQTLNLTQATVYRDIRALSKQSKEYVYEIAKGDYLGLAYRRGIDGISFVMAEAWRQFYSNDCPPKQKPYYLRLIKDCQESIIQQVTNSGAVLAVNGLRKRIGGMGINVSVDNFNLDTDNYDSTHNAIN